MAYILRNYQTDTDYKLACSNRARLFCLYCTLVHTYACTYIYTVHLPLRQATNCDCPHRVPSHQIDYTLATHVDV